MRKTSCCALLAGIVLALVVSASLGAEARRAAGDRPNIVYVVIDELGYFELSLMGNDKLKTPCIDRMAQQGMRFTQALAGGCVCAPTRSTLMTGQHLGHTSVRTNPGGVALRADDVTVAEVLKQAGYATGGFGKWGVGDRGTTGVPENHGFDLFFGYYHQVHAHSYFPLYLLRNSEKVMLDGNTGDFQTGKQFSHHLIFAEAMKFIRANKDRPFFCYCPWTPPHGRWGMPEDEPAWQQFKDKPWQAGQNTENAKMYAAMVNMVDRNVGEILALLKDLDLDENTIVFVSGDNGGAPYFADAEHPGGFFNPNGGVFRGGKGDLHEGGFRVPMVVRWPGRITPGEVSDQLWYFPDVLPTLAELAGVEPPKNIDGISIVPTLLGEAAAGRKQQTHEFLYWEQGTSAAVRMGNWRAVLPQIHAEGPQRKNPKFELYDLDKDLGETTNLSAEHPEILAKMVEIARREHTPNVPGGWVEGKEDWGFKGHKTP